MKRTGWTVIRRPKLRPAGVWEYGVLYALAAVVGGVGAPYGLGRSHMSYAAARSMDHVSKSDFVTALLQITLLGVGVTWAALTCWLVADKLHARRIAKRLAAAGNQPEYPQS